MKKILLTMFMAVTTMVAMAETYTDNLVVTVGEEVMDPQETTISVEQKADGTYTLALKNFVLGGIIPVGNIIIENITVEENNNIKSFTINQNIVITAGDEGEDWIGPGLNEVPVNLTGKMNAEHLYCTIVISMEDLGEINVVFGSEENFATSSNAVEYTDNLVVTVGEEVMDPQETTISVEQKADGTYTLALKNFVLGGIIPVGNIIIENITVEENNNIKSFTINQNIVITAGDEGEDWIGPGLNEVPVNLTGKMNAEHLYCTIVISMEELGEINVVFGSEENFATSIDSINAENGAKVIYDITGRRVNEITTAGIYIVNGKKVFVK